MVPRAFLPANEPLPATRRQRPPPPGEPRGGSSPLIRIARSGDDAILEVAAFVAELADSYQIVEAVFDPWRAGQMAQEWEQRGMTAVAFPQSDSRMIPASERLYDAVVALAMAIDRHAYHVVPLALEVKRSYRDDELATRCRRCNSSRSVRVKR